MKSFYIVALLVLMVLVTGCGKGFEVANVPDHPMPEPKPEKLFVIATATIDVNSYGNLAAYKAKKPGLTSLLIPQAIAQVAQASGVVSVTYSNPGATAFTINTSGFMAGAYPSVSGNDLNMGSISVASLDDNSLKVCTGVGAPGNKCNRLYIRVFTLGSNVANTITSIAGFINTDSSYGIDVLAGSVLTPVGYNANANAAVVTNAATVYTYTIPGNMNRVKLSNTGAISFPLKADLSNAGSGNYEMRLVIQYALGYI